MRQKSGKIKQGGIEKVDELSKEALELDISWIRISNIQIKGLFHILDIFCCCS